jgi:outer membrane protein assembly factor BamA
MREALRRLCLQFFLLLPGTVLAQVQEVYVYSTQSEREFKLPTDIVTAIRSDQNESSFASVAERWLVNEAYLDATVDSISSNRDLIEIFVHEGCKYSLSDLTIANKQTIESAVGIVSFDESTYFGRAFTEELIRDISDNWLAEFERFGYYLAEFRILSVVKNSNRFTVDIRADLMPGEKIQVEGVRFNGVQRNSPDYLRRVAGIADGETLSPALLERGRQNLINSGLFEEVGEGELIFVDDTPVVLYEVSEQQLNYFDGLIGYQPDPSGSATIAGYGDILLRNTIADGNVIDLRYEQLQPLVSKLNVSAEQQFLGGLPLQVGAGLNFTQQDSSYLVRDFKLSGGYRLLPGFIITGTVRAERSSVTESGVSTEAIDSRANFYGIGFNLRNINRYRVPTRGYESMVMLERGRRFINDERFQSETGRSFSQTIFRTMIRGYIPVGSRQVLAPMVSTLFLESPHYLVTDLFRFGGAESLRGFREDQFRGSSVVWGELEGRYMLQQNSYLFLFGAYGFYERPQLINEESDDLAFKDRLTSLGFGLAFQSTLGIIKFSYAVSPNENLANGNIHVGIRAGL